MYFPDTQYRYGMRLEAVETVERYDSFLKLFAEGNGYYCTRWKIEWVKMTAGKMTASRRAIVNTPYRGHDCMKKIARWA